MVGRACFKPATMEQTTPGVVMPAKAGTQTSRLVKLSRDHYNDLKRGVCGQLDVPINVLDWAPAFGLVEKALYMVIASGDERRQAVRRSAAISKLLLQN